MTIIEAQTLKPGDRVVYGEFYGTVTKRGRDNFYVQWDCLDHGDYILNHGFAVSLLEKVTSVR
jgi:hypothetical protein